MSQSPICRRVQSASSVCLVVAGAMLSPAEAQISPFDQLHQDLLAIQGSIQSQKILGPVNASDLVVLRPTSGQQCQGGTAVTTAMNPDGTQSPFALPAGKVLMVTGVRYTSDNVPPGDRIGYTLRTNVTAIVVAEDYVINAGAAGRVMVGTTFPSPLRINSQLCFEAAGAPASLTRSWIYGYLVEDK
jgi:hypothetical protein